MTHLTWGDPFRIFLIEYCVRRIPEFRILWKEYQTIIFLFKYFNGQDSIWPHSPDSFNRDMKVSFQSFVSLLEIDQQTKNIESVRVTKQIETCLFVIFFVICKVEIILNWCCPLQPQNTREMRHSPDQSRASSLVGFSKGNLQILCFYYQEITYPKM